MCATTWWTGRPRSWAGVLKPRFLLGVGSRNSNLDRTKNKYGVKKQYLDVERHPTLSVIVHARQNEEAETVRITYLPLSRCNVLCTLLYPILVMVDIPILAARPGWAQSLCFFPASSCGWRSEDLPVARMQARWLKCYWSICPDRSSWALLRGRGPTGLWWKWDEKPCSASKPKRGRGT